MMIKCNKCGKEVPESGVLFDEKAVMNALKAPLDCNGNPIFDYSKLKQSRKVNENYCYWCGSKLEIEKTKAEAAPPSSSPALPQKSDRSPLQKWMLILIAVVVLVVLFICVKSCGSDSGSGDEEPSSLTQIYEMMNAGEGEDESAIENNGSEGFETLKVTDYSKEWAALESRLKKLGTPLDYVNANSSKDPSTLKDDSNKAYKSIKDDAYDLYQKIKDEHYQRCQKLKDAKYQEYQKIKDAAYSKYQNDEIDYSKYNDIQSEAYNKYNNIQSKAYDTYSDIQSKAYDRYQTLQSEAYDWQSKVRSIANGL